MLDPLFFQLPPLAKPTLLTPTRAAHLDCIPVRRVVSRALLHRAPLRALSQPNPIAPLLDFLLFLHRSGASPRLYQYSDGSQKKTQFGSILFLDTFWDFEFLTAATLSDRCDRELALRM